MTCVVTHTRPSPSQDSAQHKTADADFESVSVGIAGQYEACCSRQLRFWSPPAPPPYRTNSRVSQKRL
ncbi:hypothetical protein EYF80_046691 [Liparis tanakae]|uniref:Uncharacterized protein n=1 Tax=Liparis tanakae TaxID=230148 RepID=A0A4Z2FPF5_9TELE|nr:hypothetical protein EYF80_046691 [Liparis tanakae]